MKENEIMIGDFLRLRYEKNREEIVTDFQVDQLVRNGEMLFVWSKKHGNMGGVSQIEPIPLTAEILEKNGFDKYGEYFIYEEDRIYMQIKLGEFVRVFCGMDNTVSFDYDFYVHKLQHALRLCEIDKEITL